jgi:hypothetical protein
MKQCFNGAHLKIPYYSEIAVLSQLAIVTIFGNRLRFRKSTQIMRRCMTKITCRDERIFYKIDTREHESPMQATRDEAMHDHGKHNDARHNQTGQERRIDGPSTTSEPAFRGADEQFAESYLEIARLLLAYGRTDIARRRLKRVVDKFGNTSAGAESRNLLISIEVTSVDGQPPQANCTVETCGSE